MHIIERSYMGVNYLARDYLLSAEALLREVAICSNTVSKLKER